MSCRLERQIPVMKKEKEHKLIVHMFQVCLSKLKFTSVVNQPLVNLIHSLTLAIPLASLTLPLPPSPLTLPLLPITSHTATPPITSHTATPPSPLTLPLPPPPPPPPSPLTLSLPLSSLTLPLPLITASHGQLFMFYWIAAI